MYKTTKEQRELAILLLKEHKGNAEETLKELKQIKDNWGMDSYKYAGIIHLINSEVKG